MLFWRNFSRMLNYQRISKEELNLPCKQMATYLLGKILVRKLDDGTVLKGRIVETECYLGGEDKASNSYAGRKTPTNEPMFMPSGTAFVYFTYGMYFCFNISSEEPGAAVLLRALEPIEGHGVMETHRLDKRKSSKALKQEELCNGPSKLCISFNITKESCNKLDLCISDRLWLEDDGFDSRTIKIVTTSRIGIASAGVEWASKPLRFYILSNPHVSKRDRQKEKELDIV